jgi:nitrous oxide reductase accessory protein NosL
MSENKCPFHKMLRHLKTFAGLPVPEAVKWIDDKPDFRQIDHEGGAGSHGGGDASPHPHRRQEEAFTGHGGARQRERRRPKNIGFGIELCF